MILSKILKKHWCGEHYHLSEESTKNCPDYYPEYDSMIKESEESLRHKLDKIDKLTFHAGCMGNPDCWMCPIQKIIHGT